MWERDFEQQLAEVVRKHEHFDNTSSKEFVKGHIVWLVRGCCCCCWEHCTEKNICQRQLSSCHLEKSSRATRKRHKGTRVEMVGGRDKSLPFTIKYCIMKQDLTNTILSGGSSSAPLFSQGNNWLENNPLIGQHTTPDDRRRLQVWVFGGWRHVSFGGTVVESQPCSFLVSLVQPPNGPDEQKPWANPG